MSDQNTYRYLESRPGSAYRQLFLKGRRIRAEVLFRETIGPEARSPAEVARDFEVPLEAVQEAIDYSVGHQELLRSERERGLARIRALGLDQPPYVPSGADPADEHISR